MFKILVLLIAVFVIFIIARKPASEEKKIETDTKNNIVTYVCPECGEKHCNCYKENSTHEH